MGRTYEGATILDLVSNKGDPRDRRGVELRMDRSVEAYVRLTGCRCCRRPLGRRFRRRRMCEAYRSANAYGLLGD